MKTRYVCTISLVFIFSLLIIGCSSSGVDQPLAPAQQRDRAAGTSHGIWGLYQFVCDPVAETIEIVPLRSSDMHLNAIVFLEPPALLNLTLDYLEFNGDLITADIGLRHPFLGLTEFTGFDVCGIFITNGSVSGFDDTDLVTTGEGDTRLLNPDGLTRWWNPAEFPTNGTMFGYNDGLLGAPDSFADFNCTLNGYKYYTDGLDNTDDHLTVDPANRGIFSAGQKNIRRYELELGAGGLVFNYAIDANWQFPQGDPPWEAPDDFGEAANRVEAWGVTLTDVENSLWYDDTSSTGGGSYTVQVNVYDHFNADLNNVRIEAPGLFPAQELGVPTGGTDEYSTYEFDVTGIDPTSNDDTLMLITVESEEADYGGLLLGEITSAYFTHYVAIDDEPQAAGWADPITIDTDSRMPRACMNNNDEIVFAYHKNGLGIQYVVNDGSWGTPEMAYNTNPSFMHIIIGESDDTTYIAYKGWGAQMDDRHALRYQGNPGPWDYMWLYGYTGQPSILLPDDDGSFAHIYTFSGGFQIIGFPGWGSGWSGMAWADGGNVEMASTNFTERDNSNHFVGYYRDDYSRLCRISKSSILTKPVYTIYQCQAGEDVDSTAIAREDDGKLHAVYRVTDSTGCRVEYKYSTDNGQTWSSPAAVLYDEPYPVLKNYVNIDTDDNGRIYVVFAGMKWMYWTWSDDGINWATPEYIFYMDPAPISVHHTQPYMFSSGDTLHLFYLDKNTVSQYGIVKYTYMPVG